MASVNDRDFGTATKASALIARETTDTAEGSKRTRNRTFGDDTATSPSTSRRRGAFWADLVLLVLLIAVIVGGVLGYRAVKNAYAPAWDKRNVVFVVEISGVDAAILPEFWHAEAPLYASDKTDAMPIGYLMDTPYVFADAENDGRVTVRLLLHSEARYRNGKGYYCGETPILAGLSGDLRVDGVSGNGMIMMVLEADEYAALVTETSADS